MHALSPPGARHCVVLALVLLAGPIVLAGMRSQPPAPATTPQFSARSDLVSVDVTVFDATSEPIAGLTASDFTVLVDGKSRPVLALSFVGADRPSSVTPAGAPPADGNVVPPLPGRERPPVTTWVSVTPVERRIVVVVDRENIRAGEGQEVLAAAGRFVRGLPPTDRVAAWSLPARTTKLSFEESRDAMSRRLERMLGTFDVMVGGLSVPGPLGQAGDGRDAVLERAMRASDTINGLRDLVLALQPLPGPKHIMLVTGGAWMDVSNLVRVQELAALAAASRTQFHAMHVRPLPAAAERADFAGLQTACNDFTLLSTGALAYELAILTGGFADTPSPGLIQGAAFDRFARQISAWYILGFEPAPTDRDGRNHTIEVQLKKRLGATVRSRRSFRADPVVATMTAATPGAKTPAPAGTWNKAAQQRAALGLPPFTWSAEWLQAGTRFCASRRFDAELDYVATWDEERLRALRASLEWSLENLKPTPLASPEFVPADGPPAVLPWMDPPAMRRAAVLHSVAFFWQFGLGDRLPSTAHLDLAGGLLRAADAGVPRSEQLYSSWVNVTAKWLWRMARLADARNLARTALSTHPDDCRLHAVAGMLEELAASPLAHPGYLPESLAEHAVPVRSALLRAEQHYRRALTSDPEQAEARLRLGRVLDLLGKSTEARTEFARVLASNPEPDTRWLAHMLVGRAHARAGRYADAVDAYERAVGISASQTATLALAHALDAAGDRNGALARLGTVDEHARVDCPEGCDPWQTYDNPDPETINALLKALVARACGDTP